MTELSHVGVKGMKWGVRKAVKNFGGWAKQARKVTKSSFTNPWLTDKANAESIATGNLKTRLRRSMLYQSTKDLKDVNARIAVMKAHVQKTRTMLEKNKTKGTGPLGYKTSENHAKDLAASWKAKDVKNITLDLTKGVGKAALEFTVGFVAVYGTMATLEKLTRP